MEKKKTKRISYRVQVSALLVIFSALAVILPGHYRSAYEKSPAEMVEYVGQGGPVLTVDAAARIMLNEEENYQFIDLRPEKEYLEATIPGAVNIPADDLFNPDWSGYLADAEKPAVLFSNGTALASAAQALCRQAGYDNVIVMEGGMNEWFDRVMNSEFSGGRISAAENARFETRYRAREYFTRMNSLPDSLKIAYLEVKRKKEAELVGGCE